MEIKFQIQIPASKQSQDFVHNKLTEFNSPYIGDPKKIDIAIIAKNKAGKRIGGIIGTVHWNYVYLALLWIAEDCRHKGIGKQLLKKIEAEAVKRGCEYSYLDTFAFQAPAFYEKFGYKKIGKLPKYRNGIDRIFYLKKL